MRSGFKTGVVVLLTTIAATSLHGIAQDETLRSGMYRLPSLNGEVTAGSRRVYTHPDGPKGWYYHGFMPCHDGTVNGRDYAGIAFDVVLPEDRSFVGEVQIDMPERPPVLEGRIHPRNTAAFSVAGEGRHRVFLTWDQFGHGPTLDAWVRFIKTVTLSGAFVDGAPGLVEIADARLTRGSVISVACALNGQAAPAGGEAVYEVVLDNCTDQPVAVTAEVIRSGWEEMPVAVDPPSLTLRPYGSGIARVTVSVTPRVVEGGFEKHQIRFVPNGHAPSAGTAELFTSRVLPGPNLMHTPAGWDQVRAKCETEDWAAAKRDQIVAQARAWEVPVSHFEGGDPVAGQSAEQRVQYKAQPNVFDQGDAAVTCGIAWQLSRDRRLAVKVALFLRRISDPDTGFPATRRAHSNSQVQEGGLFQSVAKAYDLIKDADVLSRADERQLEQTFRLYEEVMHNSLRRGNIGNWQIAMCTGGLMAALAMDDMAMADRFINGPSKLQDMFAAGFMSDGWWHECSLSYSSWVASMYLEAGIALRPRGIDWINRGFPLSYSNLLMLYPDARKEPSEFAGMDYIKYGPVTRSSITLKDIYLSMLPFMDYRGVAFGMNDNQSKQVGGQNFELAYHVYRCDEFLPVLKRLRPEDRDLVYGAADLPDVPAGVVNTYEISFHADNIGYAVLRSQDRSRPVEERIQAALKYGTHGGHHGHYDRTNLACLMRYGRNLGSPKGTWFSYVPVFYKCFNQMSTQHNLVVVDQKNQEPLESRLIMFHGGDRMQAAAVETKARWGFIPAENQGEEKLEKLWRYIAPYPDPPENPAKVLGFTEPIRQRRLLVVADDYVLVADAIRGEAEHTYDHSLWIRGLRDMAAPQQAFLRRDAQLDADPRKAAQLITNVDWHTIAGTLKADYSYEIRPGTLDETYFCNTPGPINYGVFHAWPREERRVGVVELPNPDQQKQLWWEASRQTGEVLAEGYTQPWVIGSGEMDLDIEGLETLILTTELRYRSPAMKDRLLSLFWNGQITTAEDQIIPLADVPYASSNIMRVEPMSEDYFGGPIDLAGVPTPKAIPAEPEDNAQPGLVTLNLGGLNAVRLQAKVASDHPLGNVQDRRRGLIVRQKGTSARFVTVIEPHRDTAMVENAEALSAEKIEVTLTDGRRHLLSFSGLDGDGEVSVRMREYTDTRLTHEESSL